MNYGDIATTLFLSLRIAIIATAVNLPLAVAFGYLLAKTQFRGKAILDGALNLPLVMPPVTTGYLLLLVLGRRGLLGSMLFSRFGVSVAFTTAAAVLAAMVVSFPLVVRSVRLSLEMVDPRLERAALTLGAGRLSVFWRVTLPIVLPGILNGAILGFARSLGEFGATITFAGNIAGKTRTIPLSVYSLLQVPGREREAALLVTLSVVVSFLAMFLSASYSRRMERARAFERSGS